MLRGVESAVGMSRTKTVRSRQPISAGEAGLFGLLRLLGSL